MIEFQNSQFGYDIEAIVTEIQKVTGAEPILDQYAVRLQELIFDRLGIKTNIIYDGKIGASFCLVLNKKSILLPKDEHGYFKIAEQEAILKQARDKKGYIDLKNCKVSGLFSEYVHQVHINFYHHFHTFKLTPGETTAVLLHELGHIFYKYAYSDRLETVNQVLANVYNEIAKKKDKDLVYIYKELKSINEKVTEADIEKMINGQKIIAGFFWSRYIIEAVESQTGNELYEQTATEQTADQFTSRFGYGKQLIIALDKTSKHIEHSNYSKDTSGLEFTMAGMFATASIIAAIMNPLGIAVSVFFYWIFSVLYITYHGKLHREGEVHKDYTYDDIRDRYKRIRNDYVNRLKDLSIPKDQLRIIIDNIHTADAIIEKAGENKSLVTKISNFVFSDNRAAYKAHQEERLLEDLAANDLFIKAAELKTL